MDPNAFALGFIVGIVGTLTLLATTARPRGGGYQPGAPGAPGTPPSGPAGVSQKP